MSLLNEITAKCHPDLVASRDYAAIASMVSAGRTKTVETRIGLGKVLSTLGATDGAEVLDKLEAATAVSKPLKWAFRLLSMGDLDIGNAQTIGQIDALTGAIFTPDQAALLKGIAVVADPVSAAQVEAAMLDPEAWVTQFNPRRPGETVGSMTASRKGFTYTGSLNNDIQETVDAFWSECLAAEARAS